MPPTVDLVLVFRSSTGSSQVQPKALARQNARQASEQYARLLAVLRRTGGLRAVGKRGARDGQLLVLVACPPPLLKRLAQRERHSDFLSGLPSRRSLGAEDLDATPLAPADRLRLVHAYVTATTQDGGLGITPGSPSWDRVESVMALHDKLFNETWIRAWTTRQLGLVGAERVKSQFGEAVALYFAFLSSYTKFLIFISAAGVAFFFFGTPYSPLYSSLLLLWSITFVEWWRIKERVLSVRWGTRGSFRVEKRRAQYQPIAWWRRELRILTSLPVVLLFGAVLVALLTGIFVFEAFVTHLYTGPGGKFLSFSPTILFMTLVPRLLAVYHAYAVRFTDWENHSRQSSHDASLTIKTFTLSAVVAYGGLALSAFVYVPFGEQVMTFVQARLFGRDAHAAVGWATSVIATFTPGPTETGKPHEQHQFWETDGVRAVSKLDPSRLQNQMFAVTVTNQVVNTFLEVGLPYVIRAVTALRARYNNRDKHDKHHEDTDDSDAVDVGKKRVAFADDGATAALEKSANGRAEREFLGRVRAEAALPPYELFADYSEMVTQFGYVALWSAVWPLAPVMSLANNWLELRSDALKIVAHARRPIPARTDTIGPWLDALSFLAWLAALSNSALVYLFRPLQSNPPSFHDQSGQHGQHEHERLGGHEQHLGGRRQLLLSAAVVALAASHGYILVRAAVRHVLERVLWKGSREEGEAEAVETAVKQEYLRSRGVADVVDIAGEGVGGKEERQADGEGEETGESGQAFWEHDEGLLELSKGVKDA